MVHGLRTWVEVSESALLWNFGQFQRFFEDKAQIAPVIKANAYGHDMALVAKTLSKSQIWGFCVAYDTEAQALKHMSKNQKILVLSAWQSDNLATLIRTGVRIVVWDMDSARMVAHAARNAGQKAVVHIKIDTGTSRLGTRPDDLNELNTFIKRCPDIELEGVFSHFAESESANLTFTNRQQQLFSDAAGQFSAAYRHVACTAAGLRLPLQQTNLVRLGIGLYGLWPSEPTKRDAPSIHLKPALAWKTRVLQIKKIPANVPVGYDRTFVTKRTTMIATLPVGYADGYDRRGSSVSQVVINETLCPVIGRVSMNLMTVDASRVRGIHPGAEAALIGPGMSTDRLADSWGTIHYEVVSRIDRQIPRVLVN